MDFYRWFLESARWLVLTKKPEKAVKNLKSVARINGRRSEGDKINLEVMRDKANASGTFLNFFFPLGLSCLKCLS